MTGPGKYDELCTFVRDESKAVSAAIIIIDGNKGSGFSVQFGSPADLMKLPGVLRSVAAQIEQDRISTLQ